MRFPLKRSLAIAALSAAALIGLPVVGPDAHASDIRVQDAAADDTSVTWALEPAGEAGADGRVSLRHTVDAGAAVADHIALTNFSAQAVTFDVYASDGAITADGNFDLIPSDQQPTGGGSWITVSPIDGASARAGGGITVQVPAQTTVVIPVAVAVPANATPGDHPAGIVAELRPTDDSDVQFVSRVGVRLHLRVAGDVVAQLVPEQIETTYTPSWNPFAPGVVTVEYVITNEGNIRLGSTAALILAGPFGLGAATNTQESREILPGQSTRISAQMEAWPLFVAWGETVVTPAVVGDDAAPSTLTPAVAEFTVVTIPWAQLVLLLLVAGIVVLIVVLRKRSQRRIQERIAAAVAAATGGGAETSEG